MAKRTYTREFKLTVVRAVESGELCASLSRISDWRERHEPLASGGTVAGRGRRLHAARHAQRRTRLRAPIAGWGLGRGAAPDPGGRCGGCQTLHMDTTMSPTR